MVVDIGQAFVFLRSGPMPTGVQLSTRVVSTSGTEIRVATDSEGFRHLLVAVDDEIAPDRSSAALTLVPHVLDVDGTPRQFADLRCTDARLALVFERLAYDVATRIEGGATPVRAIPAALREWRSLFKGGPQGTTVEQVVGLIGELQVLQWLAGVTGHESALEAWWGPDGHTHDFYDANGRAIEVKATRSMEGNRVHISNVAQLDPSDVSSLHLVVFRLKVDQTAPTLDERIADLLQAGFPAADLLNKVQAAGHVYESEINVNTRFKVLAESWWRVGDTFPGIRESRLPSVARRGVSDIKYQLSLDAVGAPLSADQVKTVVQDLAL